MPRSWSISADVLVDRRRHLGRSVGAELHRRFVECESVGVDVRVRRDLLRATGLELADEVGLEQLAAGWREWGTAPDGWFAVLHGEVLVRV